jgi:hypothetical protein
VSSALPLWFITQALWIEENMGVRFIINLLSFSIFSIPPTIRTSALFPHSFSFILNVFSKDEQYDYDMTRSLREQFDSDVENGDDFSKKNGNRRFYIGN